ncbi:MAG: anaerobic sulfatase maturase [Bacteroidales bacterium]|nr:anaerobic sulfatase maturase [Bacteroidales bacterium]
MIKPAGSLCNLDCSYCYYLDKSAIYGGRQSEMSLELLEKVIREYIGANELPELCFNWHGGEPMVMGLGFYEKALAFERKYADGRTVHNTIQTNGTLVDRKWASFFRDNDFLVGVSIDGPKDIHDRYRRDRGGYPTFDKVMEGIHILNSEGVQYNTMTTVNHACEGRGREVYEFLKSAGSHFMQFMPVVEHVRNPHPGEGMRPVIVPPGTEGSFLAPWSVGSLPFGRFMTDIFECWIRHDIGRYFVNLFDATLAGYCGVLPGTCVFGETCGDNAVIEHNGDVYPCDHYVYGDMLLGNITESPISDIVRSDKMVRFGIDKRMALPRKCRECRWSFVCKGECPKHRFDRTSDGEPGLNALCEGYRYFFETTAPYFRKMRDSLSGVPSSF